MEEYKKDDRGRAKAKRLTQTDPHSKVDSSTWTPESPENAGVKTGARPISKRLFKKGGKVIGKDALKRADRAPRKSGGRAPTTPDSMINRNVREANEEREGIKHVGAFKKGGKAKAGGGMLEASKKAMMIAADPHRKTTRPAPQPQPPVQGQKRGGRTNKFGGGMLGSNPVSDQDKMMGKAAGMMNKGGRAKKARGGPEGDFAPSKNKPSLDEIGEMIRNMPQDSVYQAPKKAAPVSPSKNIDDYLQPSTGDAERAANAAAFDAQQQAYQRSLPQNQKRGGKVHSDAAEDKKLMHKVLKPAVFKAKGGAAHPDVAEDKALIRKMVKPSARTGKAEGGSNFDSPTHSFKMKLSNGEDTTTHNLSMPGESAANALVNAVKFANKGGWNVDNIEHTGSSAGAGSSAGLMKRGGRTMKYGGGGVFSGNSKEKIPGATGGRTAHAKGGKAGKTTINIVMGGHGQQPQNYPNAPVMPPRPPAGVPVPPPATAGGAPMMPPQGMPPQMPPQGGDMPMPRKSGGRIGKLGGGSLGSQMGSAGNGMGRGAMLGAGAGGMPNTNGPRGGNPTPPLFGGGNVQPTGPMTGMGYAKMMQTMNGQGVPFPSAQGGQNVPPPPPPFFGQGGQGGNPPPVQGYAAPPNMMPRKSGGRTNYPIDTGAGGANARLEKIDAYGLKPSKRK